MTALDRIYRNINSGMKYAKWFDHGVRYPFWDIALSADSEYIYWRHYGSSAVRNCIEGLKWTITVVYGLTPEQFESEYTVVVDSSYFNK